MHFVLWIWCLFSNTYYWTFQCIRGSFPTSPPIGLLGNILPQTHWQRTSRAVSWRHASTPANFSPPVWHCGRRSASWDLNCIYYWPVGKSKVSVQQKWINTRCCAIGCTPHKWCRILSLPACGKKSWWLLPGWHNSKHLRKEEYSTPILTSWSFLSALQTRYSNVMS